MRCSLPCRFRPPLRRKAPAPAEKCDVTDPAVCLFPWPNDAFTVRDKSTRHGRRLALDPTSTPRNKDGVLIDPSDINRADGFSPGSAMLTKVPGLDTPAAAEATGLPRAGEPRRRASRAWLAGRRDQRAHRQAPADLGRARLERRRRRQPRADHPPGAQPQGGRALHRRPAQPASERTASRIPASAAFRAFRDRISSQRPAGQAPPPPLPAHLQDAAQGRACAATTSTSRGTSRSRAQHSLAGRALALRDSAFAALGDHNLRDLKVEGALAVVHGRLGRPT